MQLANAWRYVKSVTIKLLLKLKIISHWKVSVERGMTDIFEQRLRRNPPAVQVTKRTKTLYRHNAHHFGNFCASVLNIVSKQIISTNMECQKYILKFIWNTWKYSGEMKLMMNFYLFLHNFSELWNLFCWVPMENCFRCYFTQLFI